MQHLQYNSPMQLYSTEIAEEEYRLHASQFPGLDNGQAPGILGSGRRQFNPSQSETLRAIQEQNYNQNDQFLSPDFFDKVAVAEEPRVSSTQQPEWVNESRNKSERAQSHTPIGRQYKYDQQDPYDGYIPCRSPPVYTTNNLAGVPTVRYNSLPRARRSPSRHNPVPGASERGYFFGGMDFIDHSRDTELFNNEDDYQYWVSERQSRKDQNRSPERPGQKFGLDYNLSAHRDEVGYEYDENYKGYTAQYPRKTWHYAADPLHPCNSYVTDVVECVDPVRLVGDTLSNHRIPMDYPLTEEEKANLGTSFSPAPGFLTAHRTSRPEPAEPEPICYSLSVKKHLARKDGGYTPAARSQSVGANARQIRTQTSGPLDRKEVSVNSLLDDRAVQHQTNVIRNSHRPQSSDIKHERWQTDNGNLEQSNRNVPVQSKLLNWSQHVQNRRNLWEEKSRHMDEWVGRPATYKVRSERPSFWTKRAAAAQNVWQPAAERGYLRQSDNHNTDYVQNNGNWSIPATDQKQESNDYAIHGRQVYEYKNENSSVNRPSAQFYEQSTYTGNTNQPTISPKHSHEFSSQQTHQQPTRHEYEQVYRQEPQQFYQQHNFNYEEQTEPQQQYHVQFKEQTPIPPPHQSRQHIQSNSRSSNFQQNNGNLSRPNWQQTKQPPVVPPKPNYQQAVVISQTRDYDGYYHKEIVDEDGRGPRLVHYSTQKPADFDRYVETSEQLPHGQISNTFANTQSNYRQQDGHNVAYRRELTTTTDPKRESKLLKEEESRTVEEQTEPGVISRHKTTKYYKKKTVADQPESTIQ
ncbi:ZASP domain-containing protein [Aphelenchoides besseyi]|nr:ZASP domain-containing protein [Aphelenchoides besseyi]